MSDLTGEYTESELLASPPQIEDETTEVKAIGTQPALTGIEHSESLDEFFSAMCKAQSSFLPIVQDMVNDFFSKPNRESRYPSFKSIINATRPALTENSICVLQPYCQPSDFRHVAIKTILGHESGQYMAFTFEMPVEKNTAHGHGSASTYNRRYSYVAITCVAPDEDDDGNAAAGVADSEPEARGRFDNNTVYVGASKAIREGSPKEDESLDDYETRIDALVDARASEGHLDPEEAFALGGILQDAVAALLDSGEPDEAVPEPDPGPAAPEEKQSPPKSAFPPSAPPPPGPPSPPPPPPPPSPKPESPPEAADPKKKISEYRKIRKQMSEDRSFGDLQSTMDAVGEMIRLGEYNLTEQEKDRLRAYYKKRKSELEDDEKKQSNENTKQNVGEV